MDFQGEAFTEIARLLTAASIAVASGGRAHELVRAEEVISTIASFAGECALRQTGDVDFANSSLAPGRRVFSAKVNILLSGDTDDWRRMLPSSAFGTLYSLLTNFPQSPWPAETFPSLPAVFRLFAEHKPTKEDWGFVPLSVPLPNRPKSAPLQTAFKIRNIVAKAFPTGLPDARYLGGASVVALIKALNQLRGRIPDHIALALACETINGMAKTAPFLEQHATEVMADLKASNRI